MVASIRGMVDDWRNPRNYGVAPVEVEELWGGKRYKTKLIVFLVYGCLFGGAIAAPPIFKSAPVSDETVITLAMTTPDVTPLTPPPPPPQETLKPQPITENKPAKVDGGGVPSARPVDVPPPPTPAPENKGGGGGGGKNEATPASKGEAPEFAKIQLVPPMVEAINPDPVLVAPQTLVAKNAQDFSFNIKSPSLVGLPTAPPDLPKSSGTGSGGGIGDGKGRGLGEGEGPGRGPGKNGGVGGGDDGAIANRVGSPGNGGNFGGVKTVGGGVKAPVPYFSPNPAYSEDARKNKITGQVLLELVVKEDGTVDNIKLLRKLGYGLDESAIATVKTWKFRPGTEDGKPVPVRVTMEVTFRLL
jgi:TonB family protein